MKSRPSGRRRPSITDTKLLESFLAVVDSGSLVDAARRLDLSPPGLAKRLSELEVELDTPCLVRSGATLATTDAGAAIVEPARRLVAAARDLALAAAGGGSLAGALRLGAVATAITGVLPGALAALRAAHPGIEIGIVPGASGELYEGVVNGALDAAVTVQPHFALPKACGWRTLREETFIVLAPGAMAGADAHGVLAAEPFIHHGDASWTGQLADAYLRKARIRTHDRFELARLDAIAVLVGRGLGVSLVPDWAPPWPEGLSLTKLPLPRPAPVRRLGLLWGAASPRIRLVRALLEQAPAIGCGQGGRAGLAELPTAAAGPRSGPGSGETG